MHRESTLTSELRNAFREQVANNGMRIGERTHTGGMDDDTTANKLAKPVLSELENAVTAALPWRRVDTGAPVCMRVLGSGHLGEARKGHEPGTPFVTVGVDNWEAAIAVRDALEEQAGLTPAEWAAYWTDEHGSFRSIDVFPTL